MILPPDVEIDPEAKRLTILGKEMPVGCCHHNLGDPPRTHSFGLELKRPRPATEEVASFDILCGENGWWIELMVYLEDGTMDIARPDQTYDDWLRCASAEEVLVFWKEASHRTDSPYDSEWIDEYDSPFGGLEPGTWLWDDGKIREMSPEEYEQARAFMLESFPNQFVQ